MVNYKTAGAFHGKCPLCLPQQAEKRWISDTNESCLRCVGKDQLLKRSRKIRIKLEYWTPADEAWKHLWWCFGFIAHYAGTPIKDCDTDRVQLGWPSWKNQQLAAFYASASKDAKMSQVGDRRFVFLEGRDWIWRITLPVFLEWAWLLLLLLLGLISAKRATGTKGF